MNTQEPAFRHPSGSEGELRSGLRDRRQVERDAVLARLRDARFHAGVFCPHCGHRQVQRWGSFSGRQRYRCNGCRRTFSDLTGTPAAYLKKIELLPDYADCLATHLSVRRCALRLGIHPSTAFRWRHRLLDGLRRLDTERVSGWVEFGSFWLPESHKGRKAQREPGRSAGIGPRRSPKQGGSWYRWNRWNLFYDGLRVHVAVACDRTGHIVSGMWPHPTRGSLTARGLEAALDGRIKDVGPLNVAASRAVRGPARTFAIRRGATYHDPFLEARRVPGPARRCGGHGVGERGSQERRARSGRGSSIRARPGERSLVHVRTVVPYIRRFRDWLRGFRGVATRYLPNYLLWHRLIDSHRRNRFQSVLLRWPRPGVVRSWR